MFIAEQASRKLELRRSDTSHAAPLGLVELIERATLPMNERKKEEGEPCPLAHDLDLALLIASGIKSKSKSKSKKSVQGSMHRAFRAILPNVFPGRASVLPGEP